MKYRRVMGQSSTQPVAAFEPSRLRMKHYDSGRHSHLPRSDIFVRDVARAERRPTHADTK